MIVGVNCGQKMTMHIQVRPNNYFRNNSKTIQLAGLFLLVGSGCTSSSVPPMNPSALSSPAPLSTGSASLLSSNPCVASGYYVDAASCQAGTGRPCSSMVLNSNGASYACFTVTSTANSPTSTSPSPAPVPNSTDNSACAADGGTWSAVPSVSNGYGCKFNRNNCGNTYSKMFAADLGSTVCNAPSTDIVQATKKDGSKLCHNDWDNGLFKFRCTDNDPGHVKSECVGHIQAMGNSIFSVSTATSNGTYVFSSPSNTVQYPSSAKIPCYTKLYCNQNSTVGGWGNCTMASGTPCWPDFNANWLQDPSSHDSTTLTSTVSSVYCSK